MKIFLDDERYPVDEELIIARTVQDAINLVHQHGYPSFVSFDNDLGFGEPEGWEFAEWLIQHDLNTNSMPEEFSFYVHSQNPVRRDNIVARLERYIEYKRKEERDHKSHFW